MPAFYGEYIAAQEEYHEVQEELHREQEEARASRAIGSPTPDQAA